MATILTQSDTPRRTTGGYKVDISRGQRIGCVSSEWFSRPDDERFLSLSSLHAAVKARAERATARTVETRNVKAEAGRDNPECLTLLVPGRDDPDMSATDAPAIAWRPELDTSILTIVRRCLGRGRSAIFASSLNAGVTRSSESDRRAEPTS